MPIYTDSRYRTAIALPVDTDRNGIERSVKFLYTRSRLPKSVEVAQVYITKFGDRLDTLAFEFGGDSRLWWVIADMNDIISFPLRLEVGTKLKIPSFAVFQEIAGTA